MSRAWDKEKIESPTRSDFFFHCYLKIFILFCFCKYQTQQVVYTVNQAEYIMTQGPHGVPVAIPVQSGGSMIAIQASGAQETSLQWSWCLFLGQLEVSI